MLLSTIKYSNIKRWFKKWFKQINTFRWNIPTNGLAGDSLTDSKDLCFDIFSTKKIIFSDVFMKEMKYFIKETSINPFTKVQDIHLPLEYFFKNNISTFLEIDVVQFNIKILANPGPESRDTLFAKEDNISPDFDVHNDLITNTNYMKRGRERESGI